jgi:ATP-binding cassette subfamily B protein
MQLYYGMQEIKLNAGENNFRWAWESLQAGLFKLSFQESILKSIPAKPGLFLLTKVKYPHNIYRCQIGN